MNSTIIIIILALVFILIVWWKFFVPINKMISIDIDRTTSTKRKDLSKIIITLSTASIVLTVDLMSEQFIGSIYLKYAWFSFLVAIIIGVVMFFLEYIKDMSDEIMVRFVTGEEGKWKKEHRQLAANETLLQRILFILFYGEVVSLVIAINFLIIFGTKNL